LLIDSLNTGHDSSVTLIYPGAPAMFVIKTTTLPYVTLTWINESSLITAGHDCQPILYSGSLEEGWAAVGSLDDTSLGSARPSSLAAGSPSKGAVGRLNNEAFNRFKSADTRGTASSPSTPLSPGGAGSAGGDVDLLPTVHQNTITSVRPYEYNSDGSVGRVSTGGVDGKLVIWSTSAVGGLGGLVGKMAAANLRR
jgi:actin related protein 2/3 complex subunit 1A/1B